MRNSESPSGLHGRRRSQEGALLGVPRAALACSELTSSPPPLRTEKYAKRSKGPGLPHLIPRPARLWGSFRQKLGKYSRNQGRGQGRAPDAPYPVVGSEAVVVRTPRRVPGDRRPS